MTCSTCRHWHRLPADPANLSAPAAGHCRAAPPQITALPNPHGYIDVRPMYPLLSAEFPACGMHATHLVSAPSTN